MRMFPYSGLVCHRRFLYVLWLISGRKDNICSPRRELQDHNPQNATELQEKKHLRPIKPCIKAGEALQSGLLRKTVMCARLTE
ncbi:UNVERIFIED_CONTAM: hypothetical protein FKN15_039696 [Acipenser sinensis]